MGKKKKKKQIISVVLFLTGMELFTVGVLVCFGSVNTVDNTLMFLVDAEQCLHRANDFSASHTTLLVRRLGLQQDLRGDTARTSDPACPKGYSIPHGAILKRFGKSIRKKGCSELQHMSSQITFTCNEALLATDKHLPVNGKW